MCGVHPGCVCLHRVSFAYGMVHVKQVRRCALPRALAFLSHYCLSGLDRSAPPQPAGTPQWPPLGRHAILIRLPIRTRGAGALHGNSILELVAR